MITKDTTPVEAIKMAMEKEKRSHQFYVKASSVVTNPATKAMFKSLAEEELRHLRSLEAFYEEECLQED